MSRTGDNHGGNGKKAEQVKEMQEKFADARIEGKTLAEAKAVAGYGAGNKTPCQTALQLIKQKLDDRGMDEDWLVDQYKHAFKKIDEDTDRNFDGKAYFKGLAQIGYLRGIKHERSGPQVAIQQNFGTAKDTSGDERSRTEELLSEVGELISQTKKVLGSRDPRRVHEGEDGAENTEPHPEVVDVTPDPKGKTETDRGES